MTVTFLTRRVVEAIHDEQLARHGGARGIRDENGLESALARAEQKTNYGQPDIFELAAAYALGLCPQPRLHRRKQAHRDPICSDVPGRERVRADL